MKAFDTQVGGSHYRNMVIQPSEFIIKNNIHFAEGNIIKYVVRHRSKNGVEDLLKARHYIDMLLAAEYGIYDTEHTPEKCEFVNQDGSEVAPCVTEMLTFYINNSEGQDYLVKLLNLKRREEK